MSMHRFLTTLLLGLSMLINSQAALSKHDLNDAYSVNNVASVDAKYVDGQLHLLLGKKIQGKDSLWYQSSSDQGKTWSQAVNITQGHDIKARFHRGNDARIAVQGDNIVVVWMSKKEGTPHNSGPMVVMVSHDAGHNWQAIESPADWLDGSHGFFAMDANDKAISLAWLDSRKDAGKGAAQGLQYATSLDGGKSWSKNQTLDDRSCACCWNTAYFNGDDFYVLYRDKDPSDMALGKVDSQQQWQRLSTVGQFNWDFQGCPHIGGSLVFDNENKLFHATVGTGHDKYSGAFYLNSTDLGESWSKPVQLGDETAVHSDLAVAVNGDLIATWDHITENGFQVVYARSDDQGKTWQAPMKISANGVRASHPRVFAMDDKFLIVWTEGQESKPNTLRSLRISTED